MSDRTYNVIRLSASVLADHFFDRRAIVSNHKPPFRAVYDLLIRQEETIQIERTLR